jgi:adenylyltransferase/sulfurtransferase
VDDAPILTQDDRERYSRQILFRPLGEAGQERLAGAHALICGVGGLGSPAATYLAAAGVGRLTLVDPDQVALSNLNRQVLHWERDLGRDKVHSARRKLRSLNSGVRIAALAQGLTRDNALTMLAGVDVALDCLDNLQGRLILNGGCVERGVPLVHGGVRGMAGQVTTVLPGRTPCLACIFHGEAAQPGPMPVLGAAAALVASLQVLEAVKLLAGFGDLLAGRMLHADAQALRFRVVNLERRDHCPICGSGRA